MFAETALGDPLYAAAFSACSRRQGQVDIRYPKPRHIDWRLTVRPPNLGHSIASLAQELAAGKPHFPNELGDAFDDAAGRVPVKYGHGPRRDWLMPKDTRE